MGKNTAAKTLWSQSMFESLFVALRRGSDDAKIREILHSLCDRGYSASLLAERAGKTLGPNAAAQVLRLCPGDAAPAPVRRSYKVSRIKLLKSRLGHWWDDRAEKACVIWDRLLALVGRG